MDSILRGNVGDELLAQLSVSGKERALLVPANPVLKRTIRDGIYYYDGIPLNELSFTNGSIKKTRIFPGGGFDWRKSQSAHLRYFDP